MLNIHVYINILQYIYISIYIYLLLCAYTVRAFIPVFNLTPPQGGGVDQNLILSFQVLLFDFYSNNCTD